MPFIRWHYFNTTARFQLVVEQPEVTNVTRRGTTGRGGEVIDDAFKKRLNTQIHKINWIDTNLLKKRKKLEKADRIPNYGQKGLETKYQRSNT